VIIIHVKRWHKHWWNKPHFCMMGEGSKLDHDYTPISLFGDRIHITFSYHYLGAYDGMECCSHKHMMNGLKCWRNRILAHKDRGLIRDIRYFLYLCRNICKIRIRW